MTKPNRGPYRQTRDPLLRFMEKVEVTDSCWIWKATTLPHGYGLFSYKPNGVGKSQRIYAHRWMKLQTDGWVGEVVMHTCDNPSCVNPDHLVNGTQKENLNDMHFKGRTEKGPTNAWRRFVKKYKK